MSLLFVRKDSKLKPTRLFFLPVAPFSNLYYAKNKHLHPMIYMRGLKSKDLLAVVDFMYQGETNILQEDLDDFLALADELQLQGLTGGQKEDSSKKSVSKPKQETQIKHKIPFSKIQSNPTGLAKEEHFKGSLEESTENYSSLYTYEQYAPETSKALATLESSDELNEQIVGLMTKSVGVQGWSCSMCEKYFNKKCNARSHIESNHIEGASHPCNICGKISRSRDALRKHLERHHGSNH